MDALGWLNSVINGYRGTALLGVAARLGLADHLGRGAATLEELAARTQVPPTRLLVLLRALVALGLITQHDGRWQLTQLGEPLRSDHPHSLRGLAHYVSVVSGPAYDGLHTSLTDGGVAFQHRFGADFYSHLTRSADLVAAFNEMLGLPELPGALAGSRVLQDFDVLVDVGGGDGAILAEVLARTPRAKGILFDLPSVLALGTEPLEKEALRGRWSVVGGDFLAGVPALGDLYLLARVLANWPDERAVTILGNCRAAMRPGDRLVLVEQVLPEAPRAGDLTELGAVDLFVNFGGGLRTRRELERVLDAAGLRPARTVPLPLPCGSSSWVALEAEPHGAPAPPGRA